MQNATGDEVDVEGAVPAVLAEDKGVVNTDPYGDFTRYQAGESETPFDNVMPRFHATLQKNQWADIAVDPALWFPSDDMAFFTWWTQRKTDTYTDPESVFFSFYLPPGAQAAIWLDYIRQGEDNLTRDLEKSMWVKFIWRVIHPPSYLLAIEYQAHWSNMVAADLEKWYARHSKQVEDVDMSFNIFSKRVITFVVGNGMHDASYFLFHVGELLCKQPTHTRKEST